MSASNPQIAVLTYMEKKILEFFEKRQYVLALHQLYAFMKLIREDDRDSDLKEQIRKEYNGLMGTTAGKRESYASKKAFIYMDWLGDIMEILFEKGYLVDKGYKVDIKEDDLGLE